MRRQEIALLVLSEQASPAKFLSLVVVTMVMTTVSMDVECSPW